MRQLPENTITPDEVASRRSKTLCGLSLSRQALRMMRDVKSTRASHALMSEVDLLKDGEIRSPLLKRIRSLGDSRIVEELGLLRGEIRIDVALISTILEGFEIKSGRDTLSRLPRQIETYGRIFDRVTLVTVARHASRARRFLPSWWGIWTIYLERGFLCFEEVRSSTPNPCIDLTALVHLLWRDEGLELLARWDPGKARARASREDICEKLLQAVPAKLLRQSVLATLAARGAWRHLPSLRPSPSYSGSPSSHSSPTASPRG